MVDDFGAFRARLFAQSSRCAATCRVAGLSRPPSRHRSRAFEDGACGSLRLRRVQESAFAEAVACACRTTRVATLTPMPFPTFVAAIGGQRAAGIVEGFTPTTGSDAERPKAAGRC
jgi:hypothetical protein